MTTLGSKGVRFSQVVFSQFIALVAAAISVFGFSAISSAQPRIVFYQNPNYTGDSFEVQGAGEISDLNRKSRRGFNNWNDVISSIELIGDFKITLFRDRNFSGPSVIGTASARTMFNLAGQNWDNQVTSMRWEPVGNSSDAQVIFYDRPNYQGNSFILFSGDALSKLRNKRRGSRFRNWNDEIRSVRIIGSDVLVTLYTEERYRGPRVTLSRNTPSLSSSGFSAVASSVLISD
jgi:hypothetical protein